MRQFPRIKISIIIVNYKVSNEICQLLRSLTDTVLFDESEIIIVDNNSQDNSEAQIVTQFPFVRYIQLKTNIGFGKACNIGAQHAKGRYYLFINPDTIVSRNTLTIAYDFMETHQNIGIVGPKIIEPNGKFQPQCRRSFPTPLTSIIYFLHLHRLFPKKPFFNRYLYSHIDNNISMQVDSVSGSFMFMRASVFHEINGFDKDFFMFGEDIDICERCLKTGSIVWYNPEMQIIHYKGKSCAKSIIKSRIAFYEAMIIYTKKHNTTSNGFFPNWLLIFGIAIFTGLNIAAIFAKSAIATFIDIFLINITMWISTTLRFQYVNALSPYSGHNFFLMILMHSIITLSYLTVFAYRGIYFTKRYSIPNIFLSSIAASTFFLAFVYFFKQIAFSRIAFGIAAVMTPLVLMFWRIILPRLISDAKRQIYNTGNIIIIGRNRIVRKLLKNLEQNKTGTIIGIIWPEKIRDEHMPSVFEGYPVLGGIDQLTHIVHRNSINFIIVAAQTNWYSSIIELLTFGKKKNLTIQWVPHEFYSYPDEKIPDIIPLNDFSV